MRKVYMAGVLNADVFAGDQLLFTAKTLTDSSLSISVSNEEIRAGQGAKLIGRYFHTSGLSLELKDALFRMEYIALNMGTDVVIGGDTLTDEEVVGGKSATLLTVTGNPAEFGELGVIGWYTEAGQDNWKMGEFTGKQLSATGIIEGKKYCVKYNTVNDASRQVTIPGNIIPSEVHIVLSGDLFLAEEGDNSAKTKIGYVEIDVPRFQLNGGIDLALTMTGASQTPLSGVAMATTSGTSCSQGGYYAKIKEVQFDSVWYENVVGLAVADSSIDLSATIQSEPIVTYAVRRTGGSQIIPPKNLTYTLEGSTVFEVDGDTGEIKLKGGQAPVATTTENIIVGIKPIAGKENDTQVTEIKAVATVTYTVV